MGRFLLGFVLGFIVALAGLLSLGTFLRDAEAPRRSDVIVALSGDTSGARAAAAARLYLAGYAPVILFSGASSDPASVPSAELMARDAVALGVPREAIVVEPNARTTEDNARLVRDLMLTKGYRTAILVTSGYHQRRAALVFDRAFGGSGLSFCNVPADDPDWDAVTWWRDPDERELTVVELGKLALAILQR